MKIEINIDTIAKKKIILRITNIFGFDLHWVRIKKNIQKLLLIEQFKSQVLSLTH